MIENKEIKDRLSWWECEHFLSDVDYTIIGNGIVGLSTAIELKTTNPLAKVLVVDKKATPIGASTKNAGFACFGSISEILDDYNSYGEAICQKLIEMRWQGLSILKSRISEVNMRYKPEPGAEIFTNVDDREYYKEKLAWANSFVSSIVGAPNCFYGNNGKFGYEIVNSLEGSLNPQMMMSSLEQLARKSGVQFMSGIEVKKIDFDKKAVVTNFGILPYKKLIVCTNGFSNVIFPEKNVKPARNQVFITKKMPGFKLDNCYHMNKGYVYFRELNGRLLIGGGRNANLAEETTDKLGTTELILSYLKDIVQEYILPKHVFEIEHVWSGILGVGDTKMPIVEMINEDVLVAIRMGGMGVAVGSFIGKVASSMIQSIDNRAHQLYVR